MQSCSDRSLPFALTSGKNTMRFTWNNGKGNVEGETAHDLYAWKQLG